MPLTPHHAPPYALMDIGANRYLVFQCLEHTVGWPTEKWRVLDNCHRRRNAAEYEGNIDLPASLTAELVRLTAELIGTVSELERRLPLT